MAAWHCWDLKNTWNRSRGSCPIFWKISSLARQRNGPWPRGCPRGSSAPGVSSLRVRGSIINLTSQQSQWLINKAPFCTLALQSPNYWSSVAPDANQCAHYLRTLVGLFTVKYSAEFSSVHTRPFVYTFHTLDADFGLWLWLNSLLGCLDYSWLLHFCIKTLLLFTSTSCLVPDTVHVHLTVLFFPIHRFD